MEQTVICFLMVKKFIILRGANSYLFLNGKEIHNFKIKDSKIVATPLCGGNISKDWTADNLKKTGLNEYVYDLVLIMILFQLMICWTFTII